VKEVAVSVKNVKKRYGTFQALDDLSFEVRKGETVCLLGPNGAGKTTTIKMLLGLLDPDKGKVKVLGGSPRQRKVKYRIGCTPQDSIFPTHVRVEEILEMVAAHFPTTAPIEEMLERFGIQDLSRRNTQMFLGGQRRCFALVCAFVNRPEVVFLDEPTVALDVEARRALWDIIRIYQRDGGTIVLTTHYLQEAEELSHRIVVVNRGRVIREGTPEDIKRNLGFKRIQFRSKDKIDFPASAQVEFCDGHYRVVAEDADAVVRDIVAKHDFHELQVYPVSLEEAFVQLVGEA
jgi:ABC-2 type transport system ATP-binding protein